MKIYKVIGLMSGTSLDGVDAALISTDGEGHVERHGFLSVPYNDTLRLRLRACLHQPVEKVRDAERDMTQAHAEAVRALLKQENIPPGVPDLIGFHGQTISHDPAKGHTCQIGDGELLAKLTGVSVVNDFRSADVKAGGQGAPLVPVYHQALAAKMDKPVAFLNIGGVANVTYVGHDVIAFDTGPGNALIDDWVLEKTGKKFDADGAVAAGGKVDKSVLQKLLSHPFFSQKPPKSLDRNAFSSDAWQELSTEDGASTLAAFTAESIARSRDFLPEQPGKWIVSGGGRLNKTVMKLLQEKLGAPVTSIDTLGLNGDAIEAEAFAYLAVRSLRGLPISFPSTTGAPRPMTGGRLNKIPDAA